MKKLIAITSLICLIAITAGFTNLNTTPDFKTVPDDPQGRFYNPWIPVEQHNFNK